jgi:hypothetical protein
VLERAVLGLVGHHRKTYSSLVYLSGSILLLIVIELIRQSMTLERKLQVW